MLGLTLECARCHDHKFDPITQRDYYALFAFFNSIDESGLYSHFTNATPTPTLPLWPDAAAEQHAAVQARIARLEARLRPISRATHEPGFARLARRTASLTPPAPVVRPRLRGRRRRSRSGRRRDRSPRIADSVADAGPAPGRSAADHRCRASRRRQRRLPVQRRQRRRPSRRADVPPHRSVLDRDPPAADRAPGSRGRPAPVALVDGRRQPRLRDRARPRAADLRADPLLAGQRRRHPRDRAAAARHVVDARRHLRRIEPRGRPAPLPGWRAARHRDAPRSAHP